MLPTQNAENNINLATYDKALFEQYSLKGNDETDLKDDRKKYCSVSFTEILLSVLVKA